jgi:hypothetical protein
VDLAADGSFTYTPEEGFFGIDYFRYRLVQGEQASLMGTVYVVVKPTCSCFDARTVDNPFAVAAATETDLQFLERLYPAANRQVGDRAVILNQIEFSINAQLVSNAGGTAEFNEERLRKLLDPTQVDPIDALFGWLKTLGTDLNIDSIQRKIDRLRRADSVFKTQAIWQLYAEILVRPLGNVYKVVERGSWFFGTSKTKCWQYERSYTGTMEVRLIEHMKRFEPDIFLSNRSSAQELFNGAKEFYFEFAEKIRRERPNPKSPAMDVAKRDYPSSIVLFREKPT